jgi:hypothetical protein
MDFLCSQPMKVSHVIIFHDYWDAQTLDENIPCTWETQQPIS